MAEKRAKTAQKAAASTKKLCPSCGSEAHVELHAGFGKRGYFWSCGGGCGYLERTR